jgi:hypothetical protein
VRIRNCRTLVNTKFHIRKYSRTIVYLLDQIVFYIWTRDRLTSSPRYIYSGYLHSEVLDENYNEDGCNHPFLCIHFLLQNYKEYKCIRSIDKMISCANVSGARGKMISCWNVHEARGKMISCSNVHEARGKIIQRLSTQWGFRWKLQWRWLQSSFSLHSFSITKL